MNRIFVTIVFSFFMSTASAQDISPMSRIEALNQNSIESLGISLNALGYLIGISPNSFIPVWSLKETGEIKVIQELKKSGYIKTVTHAGLPNGQETDLEFMNIQLLDKGIEIKQCMTALESN